MIFRITVWFIMLIGGAAISIYTDLIYFRSLFSNIIWHIFSLIIGILLMRAVMIISKNTGRTLAKYGRKGNIKRMETNVMVKEGVYKYMRHPMHFGLLFFPLAFAFILGSPTFIMIVAPLETLFMIIMIKLMEEPEAIKKFGAEYKEYMKTTPGFCLRKECIKALFQKVEK